MLYKKEEEIVSRELEVANREARLTRRLLIAIVTLCCLSFILFGFFVIDPLGRHDDGQYFKSAEETTATPMPATSKSPESSPSASFVAGYSVTYPEGIDAAAAESTQSKDLVASMDGLALQVLEGIKVGDTTNLRRQLELTVQLPTTIERWTVVECPTEVQSNPSYLCADVVAGIRLLDDTGTSLKSLNEEFSIALDTEIEDGRLQDFLVNVNAQSQFLIYTNK